MNESATELQIVDTIMQGGALAALIFAIVMVVKSTPRIIEGILAAHDKMLATFASEAKAERDRCDRVFRELCEEMRHNTATLVAEVKDGNQQVTATMRDLAAKNFDAIRERKT